MNDLRIIRYGLRVFWFGLAIALIGWIALRNVPPSGVLRAHAEAGESSAFVGIPAPHERVTINREGPFPYYEITQEPVYFPLAAPRFFHRAQVRLEFQDEGHPVVEIGGRTSKDEWKFDLRPLSAQMLDDLGWTVRKDGGFRIYEQRPGSRSVGELMNFGDPRRVAVYGFEPIRGEGGPVFHHVTWQSRIVEDGFDTVVALVPEAENLGDGWKAATVTVEFGPLFIDHREIQMLVSAPAMKENGKALRIRAVSVAYERPKWALAHFMDYVSRLIP